MRFTPMLFKSSLKTLSFILALIISTLTFSLPASANIADWGMVQQFKKQLEFAQSGKIQAMYDVGKLYQRGRGVNKNINKAAEWFQKAADAGHAASQAQLGILYFEGRGVPQDYNKAVSLLNAAAKQNVPSAFYQLANMFELGTGVRQDLYQSIYWYKRAQKSGYYLADGKIERLEKRLHTGSVNKDHSKSQAKSTEKLAASPLMQTLLNGRWLKRKTAVNYLPSKVTNCAKDSFNSISCISTAQERSTGSEVITYNTESHITTKNAKTFEITYINNVLEVGLLETVDGNGQVIKPTSSRIKTGKQGKEKSLSCNLVNNKTISCSKGASSFNLTSP